MANEIPVTDEIFPKNSNKSYALVELMRSESPMLGKGPEDTVFSFPNCVVVGDYLAVGRDSGNFSLFLAKASSPGQNCQSNDYHRPGQSPVVLYRLAGDAGTYASNMGRNYSSRRFGLVLDRFAVYRLLPGQSWGVVFIAARQADYNLDGVIHLDRYASLHRSGQRFHLA